MSLLTRFGVVSFGLIALVGVVLADRLADMQRQRSLSDAVAGAELVARAGVQPLIAPDQLQRSFVPIDDATRQRLDEALTSSIGAERVARLKIWNAEHWIVYSDNPRLNGRWFPGDTGLAQALAGETSSDITDLSAPENMEERDFGRLLAVYVPLRVDADGNYTTDESGEVVGAFEIYLPYAPIAAAIQDDIRDLYVALAVGLLVVYLGLFRLVAGASRRLRRQAEDNAFQATHDQLTKLPNRDRLLSIVDELLDGREHDQYVVLLLLDLDQFQDINESLGYASGDRLLRAVADRLTHASPWIARIGGDEFVVAQLITLGETTGTVEERAISLAASVGAVLDAPFALDGINLCVRPSIGIAIGDDHTRSAELLRRADTAMYVAKRTSAGHSLWTPAFDHASPERLGLAAELRDAIVAGQITMVYQPKVELATGRVTGVEALVRWNHPERGLVGPGEFLPIIENTDVIGPLTWEVLDQALTAVERWRRAGIDVTVAVNVSARTATSPELVERVSEALERHRLPPSALELELTESALLGDAGVATANLSRLRQLGVAIAIDDFGTGYASISYLTNMPISVLKIDRSFVGPMLSDPTASAVVDLTIGLSRQLDVEVVAEGIEDLDVLDELRRRGCDLAQGYYIARPMERDQFAVWLSDWVASRGDEPTPPLVEAGPAAQTPKQGESRVLATRPT